MATLARRLTLADAVVIGLGSMIGAGVFAVFAPASAAAGGGLLIALALAAVVAYCNATSSAQLAARYPTSGGTYVYGREVLGPWWGFLAGWGFVIGKTASCVAMALTVAAYVVPDPAWQRPVALGAVVGLAAVNYRGVTRTAQLARIVVAVVLVILGVLVAANLTHAGTIVLVAGEDASVYGVLQAAGLLFFAFAGYARIATMGEEVIAPRRTIPRAIVIALAITVVVYAAVAVSLTVALPAGQLARSGAPLADAAALTGPWLVPFARVGGAVAALGALLALIAGVSRTMLAMARNDDLPRSFAAVHPRFRVPHQAELALALVVSALLLAVDLRGAIGFSSFGVLSYYFVANLAAFRQADRRLYPRWLQVIGMILCLVLVATLPWQSVAVGLAVYAAGAGYRWTRHAWAWKRR